MSAVATGPTSLAQNDRPVASHPSSPDLLELQSHDAIISEAETEPASPHSANFTSELEDAILHLTHTSTPTDDHSPPKSNRFSESRLSLAKRPAPPSATPSSAPPSYPPPSHAHTFQNSSNQPPTDPAKPTIPPPAVPGKKSAPMLPQEPHISATSPLPLIQPKNPHMIGKPAPPIPGMPAVPKKRLNHVPSSTSYTVPHVPLPRNPSNQTQQQDQQYSTDSESSSAESTDEEGPNEETEPPAPDNQDPSMDQTNNNEDTSKAGRRGVSVKAQHLQRTSGRTPIPVTHRPVVSSEPPSNTNGTTNCPIATTVRVPPPQPKIAGLGPRPASDSAPPVQVKNQRFEASPDEDLSSPLMPKAEDYVWNTKRSNTAPTVDPTRSAGPLATVPSFSPSNSGNPPNFPIVTKKSINKIVVSNQGDYSSRGSDTGPKLAPNPDTLKAISSDDPINFSSSSTSSSSSKLQPTSITPATRAANRAFALNNTSSFGMFRRNNTTTADSSETMTSHGSGSGLSTSSSQSSLAITIQSLDTSPENISEMATKLGLTAPTESDQLFNHRAQLADEILKTDSVYLQDLALIINKFLQPMRMNILPKLIAPTDFAKLFLNIESLQLIAEDFNSTLKLAFMHSSVNPTYPNASASCMVELAQVYLQYYDTLLQGFSLYCAGHSESLTLLSKLKRKNPAFASYLTQLEADESLMKLKLADMLTRPIQHICRQPLLLRELLKSTPSSHPDYPYLIHALDKINQLVERVNSNAKEVGNLQSMLAMESSVSELPEGLKLLMPGRYMAKEGRFMRVGKKATSEHYLYLFNDMLLVTKPKPFVDDEYTFIELLPLYCLSVEDEADKPGVQNAFYVTSTVTLRSYLFVAKDEKKINSLVKQEWLTSIQVFKSDFDKGLAGNLTTDASGIAFKVKSDEDNTNNYILRKDQLSSIIIQQRIAGWKGEQVLRDLAQSSTIISNSPAILQPNTPSVPTPNNPPLPTHPSAVGFSYTATTNPLPPKPVAEPVAPSTTSSASNLPNLAPTERSHLKFHYEAPISLKIVYSSGEGEEEVIENEIFIFAFDFFLVLTLSKKDLTSKRPYEWADCVTYDACVMAIYGEPQSDKKIQGGKQMFALSLISASTRKKYIMYFRTETVKTTMAKILSPLMPSFIDNGAVAGQSTTANKLSSSDNQPASSTLRTKKNIFGKKLGYRNVSQSTSMRTETADQSSAIGNPNDPKPSPITTNNGGGSLSSGSSKAPPMPTPIYGFMPVGGIKHPSAHPSTSNNSTNLNASQSEDDEEEKQLTADGFEVPPWAPDDSSNVCLGCNAKFTTTNRRHHCRNCGQLFCKKCTTKKCFLPRYGFTQKKMRVCEKCFLKH